jgi:hypothetical protein
MAEHIRGVHIGAGVGGGITGAGAHLAVIDDPVKDYEKPYPRPSRRKYGTGTARRSIRGFIPIQPSFS